MQVYLDLVLLLNFLVDFLLLLGTNRLSGHPLNVGKAAIASLVGSLYAALCMIKGFRFLGSIFWRLTILSVMAVIAFGFDRGSLQRGVVFVFLSMALGGIAMGLNGGGFFGIVLSAVLVAVMCIFGFSGRIGGQSFVPVELHFSGKRVCLTALRDTGNTLKDPITGQQVLIVGPEIGQKLLGLTKGQIEDPIGTMHQTQITGLRLIPYRTVGQSTGMLLAFRPEKVCIGGVDSGYLVAISPNEFGGNGYQALTGGAL